MLGDAASHSQPHLFLCVCLSLAQRHCSYVRFAFCFEPYLTLTLTIKKYKAFRSLYHLYMHCYLSRSFTILANTFYTHRMTSGRVFLLLLLLCVFFCKILLRFYTRVIYISHRNKTPSFNVYWWSHLLKYVFFFICHFVDYINLFSQRITSSNK